jgi:hypothetical protein
MRTKKQIIEAEQEFFDRVWYNRKLVMLERIQDGVEALPDENLMDQVTTEMRRVETKYGGAEKLRYDDFEWGMVNGKLSALRWVLGDEWDDLDT